MTNVFLKVSFDGIKTSYIMLLHPLFLGLVLNFHMCDFRSRSRLKKLVLSHPDGIFTLVNHRKSARLLWDILYLGRANKDSVTFHFLPVPPFVEKNKRQKNYLRSRKQILCDMDPLTLIR